MNISCYEQHTCNFIIFNNKKFTDDEAAKEFKICSQREIDELFNSTKNTKDIIIGCTIVFLSILIIFILIVKNKHEKN